MHFFRLMYVHNYNINSVPQMKDGNDKNLSFRGVALIASMFLFCLIQFFGCTSREKKDFNLVFISLDTTRYDFIDTGKGAKACTPGLKKFSQHSLVFERAFSSSAQTLPSHLSMFTSRLPYQLGVVSNQYHYDGRYKMIQQALQERGYYTAALISLGTLSSGTGIEAGFLEFKEDLSSEEVFFAPAESISLEAINMIQRLKNQKFFLFVHYSDPHTPYAPPDLKGHFEISLDGKMIADFNSYTGAILKKTFLLSKGRHKLSFKVNHSFEDFSYFVIRRLTCSSDCSLSAQNLEYSENLYRDSYLMRSPETGITIDCKKEGYIKIFQIIPILKKKAALEFYRREVEYMDYHVDKFLEALERIGLLKKTIVVIFGDHGEGHGERDEFFGHTKFLNRQFIHIPLIVRLPGMEGQRLNHTVSLTYIAPSVLDFMGIRDKYFDSSTSLLKNIKKRKAKKRLICSLAFLPSLGASRISIIKWPYQSIFYLEHHRLKRKEFYDLSSYLSFSEKEAIREEVVKRKANKDYRSIHKSFHQLLGDFYRMDEPERSRKKIREKIKSLGYAEN